MVARDKISERSKRIDKLIDSERRADELREYFGCDVCWTCQSFNSQTNECVLTYKEAVDRVGSVILESEDYFVPVEIKKPTWYRCEGWTERK